MPFSLRVTQFPPLQVLQELEQIVIVDRTGPTLPLGPATGAVCLVGEFLKGPFLPAEVTSAGELDSIFGGLSSLLSQSAAGLQDGSGVRFEGNGRLQLKSKQFRRLAIQRVDTDMTKTDGGTEKVYVKFDVTIAASDQDPLDATKTGKDIVIPAGTRFADDTLALSTVIVALSQDVIIPKGTTIAAGVVGIAFNLLRDPATGVLTRVTSGADSGATAFFVKGTTAGLGAIDTVIDSDLPDVDSSIAAAGISTIDSAAAATAVFAAGTAAAALAAKIESLYAAAIDKTRPNGSPQDQIVVIWAARRGATAALIRTPLVNNAVESSKEGRGRVAVVSGPRVGTGPGDAASVAAAKTEVDDTTTTESPGRVDRKLVTFPYVEVFSSELGNVNVEVSPDGWMASTLSLFAEEENPGAENEFIQAIQALESEFIASPLSRQDYVNFKARGVAALRRDPAVGWWFQSGVTSVDPATSPTRAPIKRRRMADLIQDGLNAIGARYNKKPATTERVDAFVGEMESFLSGLKSESNPSLQRIEDFSIDAVSANIDELTGLGIFTFKIKVRLLATMDTIVFDTSVGETVEISEAA